MGSPPAAAQGEGRHKEEKALSGSRRVGATRTSLVAGRGGDAGGPRPRGAGEGRGRWLLPEAARRDLYVTGSFSWLFKYD